MRAALAAIALVACGGGRAATPAPAAASGAASSGPSAPWYCRDFVTQTSNGDEARDWRITTCDRSAAACDERMVFRFHADGACAPAASAQCLRVRGFGASAVECFADARDCETAELIVVGEMQPDDCAPAP